MFNQINFFFSDCKRMLGKNKARIITLWMSRTFVGCFVYRFERALFLFFGNKYKYIRIVFYPFINLLQVYTNMDIHYRADIKGGLLILHPAMGIVISGKVTIGKNLTLVGGNVIGFSTGINNPFLIGNNCSLGANAVIIGPIILEDEIKIGASACVIKNCINKGVTLVGVPAKEINKA